MRWQLLEQVIGEVFVALDVECEADTFGRAVELLLLPAAVCDGPLSALMIDVVLGSANPARTNVRTQHGVYRVVPHVASEARS